MLVMMMMMRKVDVDDDEEEEETKWMIDEGQACGSNLTATSLHYAFINFFNCNFKNAPDRTEDDDDAH